MTTSLRGTTFLVLLYIRILKIRIEIKMVRIWVIRYFQVRGIHDIYSLQAYIVSDCLRHSVFSRLLNSVYGRCSGEMWQSRFRNCSITNHKKKVKHSFMIKKENIVLLNLILIECWVLIFFKENGFDLTSIRRYHYFCQ